MSGTPEPAGACNACLTRTWLLARLAGHLELVRARIASVLALGDDDLLAAVAGERADGVRGELSGFDPAQARLRATEAGLELICRCDNRYPRRLELLENRPAVLHVAGGLARFLELVHGEPVAIVGARRASQYGLEVARSLGRDLGRAGIVVVSGMALGIDSAAHAGAVSAAAPTVAILPGGAERPYPPSKRGLHRQILAAGAAASEVPPGTAPRRWMFTARNRIIAGLAAMTIVVEAGEQSGALLTAGFARTLGRDVGAVPGRVTAPTAAGPNALLAGGATVVRTVQDVLDQLFGAGVRRAPQAQRPELAPELKTLLAAIADGHDTPGALERAGFAAELGLAALASLELAGYVRRDPGGRFSVTA